MAPWRAPLKTSFSFLDCLIIVLFLLCNSLFFDPVFFWAVPALLGDRDGIVVLAHTSHGMGGLYKLIIRPMLLYLFA